MKRSQLLQGLTTLAALAFILFIFSNSLQNGTESEARSQSVLTWLQELLSQAGFSVTVTEYFLRKSAHFLEYFALGMLLTGALRAYTPKLKQYFALPFCLGLAVAAADETLQRFVPGRSGQFSDVLLDFCGVAVGAVLFLFFLFWFEKHIRQKRPRS